MSGMTFTGANVRLDGAKELERALEQLPSRVANKAMVIALKAGGGVILDAARSKCPTGETGLLKKSLGMRLAKKRGRDTRVLVIGARHMKKTMRRTKAGKLRSVGKKALTSGKYAGQTLIGYDPANYAHLVENGRPPVRAQLMVTREGVVIGRRAKGVAARPFMRPAFHTRKRAAVAKIGAKLGQQIEKEAKRLAKR